MISRTRSVIKKLYNPVRSAYAHFQAFAQGEKGRTGIKGRPFSPSFTDYNNRSIVAESRKICMTNERI